MWRLLVAAALIAGLSACTIERDEDAAAQARAEIQERVERRAVEHRAERARLAQAADYRVLNTHRDEIGTAGRISARVEVEPGLSREKLELTLEAAVRGLYDAHDVAAANVFAYKRGTRTDGSYTAGRAVWAPGGDWSRAQEYGTRSVSVELAEAYFHEPGTGFSSGQSARLDGTRDVFVSVSADHWAGDNYLVAHMPPGTPVEVRERRDAQLGGSHVLTRYRVQFEKDGEQLTGWVHKSALTAR